MIVAASLRHQTAALLELHTSHPACMINIISNLRESFSPLYTYPPATKCTQDFAGIHDEVDDASAVVAVLVAARLDELTAPTSPTATTAS